MNVRILCPRGPGVEQKRHVVQRAGPALRQLRQVDPASSIPGSRICNQPFACNIRGKVVEIRIREIPGEIVGRGRELAPPLATGILR